MLLVQFFRLRCIKKARTLAAVRIPTANVASHQIEADSNCFGVSVGEGEFVGEGRGVSSGVVVGIGVGVGKFTVKLVLLVSHSVCIPPRYP